MNIEYFFILEMFQFESTLLKTTESIKKTVFFEELNLSASFSQHFYKTEFTVDT